MVVYRPPAGAYLQFLSEFSSFLSTLLLSPDRNIIVGDGCIDMEADNDSIMVAFNSLSESLGNKPF